MKSFKTTPKLNTNINYEKYQQSDIFIQKGLNKPEISYTHKKLLPRNTFNSSYNFLSWEEISPNYDKSIKVKLNPNNISQILNSNHDLNKLGKKNLRKNFYEKMHQTEPEKVLNNSVSLNKNLNNRYQKETMFLGNYAGDEYKIRKNKSTLYEPVINYFEQKNPTQQKMDIIYKSSENIIGNYKPVINRRNKLDHSNTSIGYLKREFETNNNYDKKIINDPKKMKYFNIYGNKGIENANKELNPIMNLSRSTNNVYTPGINCTKNRINFLKSNIFYDEVIDKKNNEEKKEENNNNIKHNYKTIKVNRHINKRKKNKRSNSTSVLINKYYNRNNIINKSNITDFNNNSVNNIDLTNINNKNNSRKFIYKNNGEDNLPVKLDWKDPKVYLLFPQNKNRDILQKNSRQRKFKNLYNINPALPKEKLCQEFKTDNRKEVEQITKNYYNNKYNDLNYAKIRKISDNISQYQIQENNKILNDHNYNVNNIKEKTYEIIYTKNRNNNYNTISNEELEKKFAKKGIHVYDIKDNNKSIINNNKNINIISFKIRQNEKDEKIKDKINEIKKEFIKDNLMMKEKKENIIENKKENNDIIPRNIYWNTPNSGLFTKNKKLINTNDGITHLKGKNGKNNNEEKITKICVNLKYKNDNAYN